MLAVVFEANLAVNFGKERVVLAEADVQSRLKPPALLTNQDRSAGDEHAIVALDAKALRVAVASVA